MTRISHYIVGMAALASVGASVMATAAQAADELGMFSSRGPDLAFAIDKVCVPYLR